MKYIMFVKKTDGGKLFQPILFGNHLVHEDVAEAMMAGGPLQGYKVRSAGEYRPFGGCSGYSETLKKGRHKDDTRIILMHDYGAGYG